MILLVIVLCDSLSDLSSRYPDNSIAICVVIGSPIEEFDTEDTFLEILSLSGKRLFDNSVQEARIAAALIEEWIFEHPLQLSPHHCDILRGLGPLCLICHSGLRPNRHSWELYTLGIRRMGIEKSSRSALNGTR